MAEAFAPRWTRDPDPQTPEDFWELDEDLGTSTVGATLRSWSTHPSQTLNGPQAGALLVAMAAALVEGVGGTCRATRYRALKHADELHLAQDRVDLTLRAMEDVGDDPGKKWAVRSDLHHRLRVLAETASWTAVLAAQVSAEATRILPTSAHRRADIVTATVTARAALHSARAIVTACVDRAEETGLPDDDFDAAVTRIDHHRDEIEHAAKHVTNPR